MMYCLLYAVLCISVEAEHVQNVFRMNGVDSLPSSAERDAFALLNCASGCAKRANCGGVVVNSQHQCRHLTRQTYESSAIPDPRINVWLKTGFSETDTTIPSTSSSAFAKSTIGESVMTSSKMGSSTSETQPAAATIPRLSSRDRNVQFANVNADLAVKNISSIVVVKVRSITGLYIISEGNINFYTKTGSKPFTYVSDTKENFSIRNAARVSENRVVAVCVGQRKLYSMQMSASGRSAFGTLLVSREYTHISGFGVFRILGLNLDMNAIDVLSIAGKVMRKIGLNSQQLSVSNLGGQIHVLGVSRLIIVLEIVSSSTRSLRAISTLGEHKPVWTINDIYFRPDGVNLESKLLIADSSNNMILFSKIQRPPIVKVLRKFGSGQRIVPNCMSAGFDHDLYIAVMTATAQYEIININLNYSG